VTRSERETLIKICRQRERVAKADVVAVAARRKADFEQQLAREYSFDEDRVWQQAKEQAEAEWKKAKCAIAARCCELGIPREFAPELGPPYWYSRGQNALRARRAELIRVVDSRNGQAICQRCSRLSRR
jgi:hypothetical protein